MSEPSVEEVAPVVGTEAAVEPPTPASTVEDTAFDDVVDHYHHDEDEPERHSGTPASTVAAVSAVAATTPNEDLDERLTQEVSYLSTQLMTVMSKQVELEEVIQHLRRENGQLKSQIQTLNVDSQNYAVLVPQHQQLQEEFESHKSTKDIEFAALTAEVVESKRLQLEAETEVGKLRTEVEDLTASLFDEANRMVSESNREVNNFKVKNGKLYEELDEKDTIIEGLQSQLAALRELFAALEEKEKLHSSRNGTPQIEQGEFIGDAKNGGNSNGEENFQEQQLKSVIFSPNVNTIRFDLNNYQKDFKQFIYGLMNPEFVIDLANLRNFKYFKKIWFEELEPSITYVPNLTVTSLMNRWNKNKHFWNAIVDGRAIIEPVNGINEVFKLGYKGKGNLINSNDKKNAIPVAIKEGCGLCGEKRNDILEHARLYYLKLLAEQPPSGSTTPTDGVVGSYPLCNYCLIKLRNLCEFFAKIRSIHQNVYQLKPNKSFEEYNYASNAHSTPTTNFKRSNSYSSSIPTQASDSESNLMNSNVSDVHVGRDEEAKLIKIYFMLTIIRNKLFWSKIGFWDNSDNIKEVNLEDLRYTTFKSLVGHIPENAIEKPETPPPEAPSVVIENENNNETKEVGENVVTEDKVTDEAKLNPVEPEEEDSDDAAFTDSSQHFQHKESLENGREVQQKVNEEEEEKGEQETVIVKDEEQQGEDVDKIDLTRKPSKSKQFKEKLNNDLDETLEMLKESIEQ